LLLFVWLAADLYGATLGGRYYPHYFLPCLLGLVIVSCIAIDALARMISRIAYFPLVLCVILIPITLAGLKGQIDFYHSASGNPPDEWKQAALFVRDHKAPSDLLFTWEFRPGVYRLADTHTITRWDSAHYINDFPEAYRSIGGELMTELRTSPPRFIVDDCSLPQPKPQDTVRIQFLELLKNDYRLVYRAGGTCVSERN
jgi:hypothetical protein